jgi:hypothetical protein
LDGFIEQLMQGTKRPVFYKTQEAPLDSMGIINRRNNPNTVVCSGDFIGAYPPPGPHLELTIPALSNALSTIRK